MALRKVKKTKIYTIPGSSSFVESLAEGLLSETNSAPEKLASITILLPTRRAGRSLCDAFLRLSGGHPLLLPRMIPLGDIEDDDLLITDWENANLISENCLGSTLAVPRLRRQLLLSRLIMARPDSSTTPGQAMLLAMELAKLLDQIHTERCDLSLLDKLVPDDFAVHWSITLEFLKLLTEVWPKVLIEEKATDPAIRRNLVLEARARQWMSKPPVGPIIAAGSTGSIPATADLLATIAGLPNGRIVLPGLDRQIPNDIWDKLIPQHPQYGMAQLLRHLGINRNEVIDWPMLSRTTAPPNRTVLINAALAPSHSNTEITMDKNNALLALEGITRINCPGPSEEAAVISLIMRHNLEVKDRTIALVTPDRRLARRVATELKRWEIKVDDTAGQPLAQTPAGVFLRLCAACVANRMEPITLLSLLKHPLTAMGMKLADCRRLTRALERRVLRGPRPAPGINTLREALQKNRPPEQKELDIFLDHLETMIAPLSNIFESTSLPLVQIVRAHCEVAETIATTDSKPGKNKLWTGEAGEIAATLMSELEQYADTFPNFQPSDYLTLFETSMTGYTVRPVYGTHPRLFIWGLLEARLQRADLMILGSLNEGSWPMDAAASPWMSRPMMARLGLTLSDRRIGLMAHDFVQALGAPQVVITRAEKISGTPTVPSRWLRLIDNQLLRLDLKNALKPQEPWLRWVAAIDGPFKSKKFTAPKPTPPIEARPKRLSVTQIETLIRDPYSIYARHVLRLKPLDPLNANPGAAERGVIIHHALDQFVKTFPNELPDMAEQQLLEIGEKFFRPSLIHPSVHAFWWPRFKRIATWFIANEFERRASGFSNVGTEKDGELIIEDTSPPFILSARADRIDHRADIGYTIIDYKTGRLPGKKEVEVGWNPQLPLEAAMLKQAAFSDIEPGPIGQLVYMRLSGGKRPGEERIIREHDLDNAITNALVGVTKLIHTFTNPTTPYLSQPRPQFLNRFGDYDHLARVKEWRGRRKL
ncbi:MAG: double-strand break repair protein AddB [Magnetovibrio sp.]|nr:double-strand break repair protein AddB [Magnetovibrio sp.]